MMDDTPNYEVDAARPRDLGLGQLFWVVPEAVIVADAADGRIVLWNPGAEALFGYSAREALRLPIEAVFPAPLNAEVQARVARCRAAGSGEPIDGRASLECPGAQATVELPAVRKTGEEIAVELTLSPIARATADGCFVLVIIRDVTEHRRSEEARSRRVRRAALQADVAAALAAGGEPRAMLQRCAEALVRHLGAAFARIWTLGEASRVLELQASAGLYTHLDGPHARVPVGQLKIGLIAEERRPHLTNAVVGDPRVADQEWAEREGMVAFAGYPLLVEGRTVGVMALFARDPLPDDTPDVLASMADAIAQGIVRKRAEEALEQERQFLKVVLDNVQVGIVACDADGVLTLFNRAMRELHRRPEQAVPADEWAERYDLHPADETAPMRKEDIPLFRALQGERLEDVEMTVVGGSGVAHTTVVSGQPLVGPDGMKRGAVVAVHDITERKRAEEALRRSEARFRAIVEDQTELICRYTPDKTITFVNDAYRRYYGRERDELIGQSVLSLVPVEQRGRFERDLASLGADRPVATFEPCHELVRGQPRWVQWTRRAIFDERGQIIEYQSVGRDVTERKRVEEALRESEEQYRSIVETATEWNCEIDREGRITYSNPAVEAILGYRPDELVGADSLLYMHDDDRRQVEALLPSFVADLRGWTGLVLRWRHKDGSYRYLESNAAPVLDASGELVGFRKADRDVTERQRLEEQLAHQAFHDSLTGLPNRALFMDRLNHALDRARRGGDAVAVMFLDLDNFKVINDGLGHQGGDRLLVIVARRLQACLRPEDTIGRLGGDEFAVLLEDAGGAAGAAEAARRIGAALRAPVTLDGQEVFPSASIGIALGAPDGDAGALLRDADVALYRAKAGGKARYALFDASMNAGVQLRLELEADLRRAVERGEFMLQYQPIMSLGTGELTRVEALVRWQHPRRGLVPPADFIPIAEETGLIVPLGEWVLRAACAQAKAWHDAGLSAVPVAVNMSAHQLERGSLREVVARTLRDTGLAPGHLELELTESAVMQDPIQAIEVLRGLRAAGVRIAIDDFGTGYSSLSYLTRLPIAGLKIDRSFVQNIMIDRTSETVTKAVVDLAHTLGLTVTAEGVETVEQVAFLRALGCDEAQGYLLGRPVPVDELAPLLRHGRSLWPRTTVAAAAHPRAAKGDSTGPHDGRGSVD